MSTPATQEAVGYKAIKAMAKERGCTIRDLLALAPNNDPFYVGSKAQLQNAQWFARLWDGMGFTNGAHLRRVHYQLVSAKEPIQLPSGLPYENTEGCWNYLGDASKHARHLGLVSPDAFRDQRNPEPKLFANYLPAEDCSPSWSCGEVPNWRLPSIPTDLGAGIHFYLPDVSVSGYEYDLSDQPFHLELWIEKSTQNDVLEPVCRRFGINLVPGAGFQSITSAIRLLERVAALKEIADGGKPCRIFYISDFDPAGDSMPVAVARQLEFYLAKYAPGSDLKLTPIALTREQVAQYRLPRIPIKEEDLRRVGFEERYGEGAVELDALEALHPGELARLVEASTRPYRDLSLEDRMADAEAEARAVVGEAWEDAMAGPRQELEQLQAETASIVERYRADLERLSEQLGAELAPVQDRLEGVRLAVQGQAEALEIELPERPSAEVDGADEADWLFDSGRSYEDQLAIYERRKATGDPEAGGGTAP